MFNMSKCSLKMSKMSHKNFKMPSKTLLNVKNVKNVKILIRNVKNASNSFRSPHFKMAFSHLGYLGLSFHPVSSELVINVCQNVITSEYQNFCCVKILDCLLEFSMGNFCANNFFLPIFYCKQFLPAFFLCKQFF